MLKGVFGRDPDSGVGSEQVLDEVFGFTRELPQSFPDGSERFGFTSIETVWSEVGQETDSRPGLFRRDAQDGEYFLKLFINVRDSRKRRRPLQHLHENTARPPKTEDLVRPGLVPVQTQFWSRFRPR